MRRYFGYRRGRVNSRGRLGTFGSRSLGGCVIGASSRGPSEIEAAKRGGEDEGRGGESDFDHNSCSSLQRERLNAARRSSSGSREGVGQE